MQPIPFVAFIVMCAVILVACLIDSVIYSREIRTLRSEVDYLKNVLECILENCKKEDEN